MRHRIADRAVGSGAPAAGSPWRAALCAAVLAAVGAGCGPAGHETAATTRPAGTGARPVAVGTRPALRAEATVRLVDLKPPIAAPKNPPDFDKLPDAAKAAALEGEKHIVRRDYPAAVAALERAVAFAPDSPRVRKELGLAYVGLGNSGKAAENLRRAAELAPDNLSVQVIIGRLYLQQRQYDRALLALRTATMCSEFKPENPWAADALLALGKALDEQGCWQAALDCYTQLSDWIDLHGREYMSKPQLQNLVVRPQRLLSERGKLLLMLQQGDPAVKLLRLAYHRDLSYPPTAKLLIDAMIATGQYAAGEKLLVDMADEPAQRGQLPALAESLCLAARDKEMPARIWKAYRAKKRATVDTSLAIALARTAEKFGGVAQAAAILEPVMNEMPGSTDIASMLAELYARQGDSARAFRIVAGLLAASPESTAALDDEMATLAAYLQPGSETRLASLADQDPSAARFAMHYVAGALARQKGNAALAAAQFRKAVEDKSAFLPAYEALADLLLAEGKYDEAEAVSALLRKVNADHYLAYYIQGKARLLRHDVRPAIDALVQAGKQNPGHVASWLLLGWACERAGDYAKAEETFSAAAEKWPSDEDVTRTVFARCVARGETDRADAVAGKLLGGRPASIAGRAMKIQLDLMGGRTDQARARLADLRAEAPDDPEVRCLDIRVELDPSAGLPYKGEYLSAVNRLREIAGRYPAHVSAGELLAAALVRDDRKPEAAEALGRLFARAPENLDVQRIYISSLLLAGKGQQAAQLAEMRLRENSQDLAARGALLEALADQGRSDEAVKLARQYLRAASDEREKIWGRFRLLQLFQKAERYPDAQDLLDDWIQAGTTDASLLRRNKLLLYGKAKKYDDVATYGKWLIDNQPDKDGTRKIVAGILLDAKQYDKLQPLLEGWEAQSPDYRALMVLLLARAGQTEKAVARAQAWIAKEPYDPTPRMAISEALFDVEKHRPLQKLAEDWLKQFPASAASSKPTGYDETLSRCRQIVVRALAAQDKHAEAVQRADEYLKSAPTDSELLQIRSTCQSELGKGDRAMADMEAAHKLKPEDVILNNNLGYLYADLGVKLPQAEAMVRKALATMPGRAFIEDSLGWVLYKRGKLREAGGVFDEMVRRAGEEGFAHALLYGHAGDTYWRLGWVDKAVPMWQAALEQAKKEKRPSQEDKKVLSEAPGKIRAAKAGRAAPVAPLGQGVRPEDRENAPARRG